MTICVLIRDIQISDMNSPGHIIGCIDFNTMHIYGYVNTEDDRPQTYLCTEVLICEVGWLTNRSMCSWRIQYFNFYKSTLPVRGILELAYT